MQVTAMSQAEPNSPLPVPTSVQQRRDAIAKLFRSRIKITDKAFTLHSRDSFVYGRRHAPIDPHWYEIAPSMDSFSFSTTLDNAVISFVITMRVNDLRIGLFVPNVLMESFAHYSTNALSLLTGNHLGGGIDTAETEPAAFLHLAETHSQESAHPFIKAARRGFDAYPAYGVSTYPYLHQKDFDHGSYIEYGYQGRIVEELDKALLGHPNEDFIVDFLVHTTSHIYLSFAGYAIDNVMQDKVARGLMSFTEFSTKYRSDEIIRIYGVEPRYLKVLKESNSAEKGDYIIYYPPGEEDQIAQFKQEIESA